MTNQDDTVSPLKRLSVEFTELQNQLQHMIAVNQLQRELMYCWLLDQGQDDGLLLGMTVTDQWQSRTERKLDKQLQRLRNKLPDH